MNILNSQKTVEKLTQKGMNIYNEILYLIFDYPHKHYTFKYFEV